MLVDSPWVFSHVGSAPSPLLPSRSGARGHRSTRVHMDRAPRAPGAPPRAPWAERAPVCGAAAAGRAAPPRPASDSIHSGPVDWEPFRG